MPVSHFLRRSTRALLVVSICVSLVTIVSVWAANQRASVGPIERTRHFASTSYLADKGGLTPEGNTITVNSLSDVANASDGLCTLREAITAANNNAASGVVAGECAAGNTSGTDTIDMTGITGTINLTGSLTSIFTNVNITGPGSGLLTIRRD